MPGKEPGCVPGSRCHIGITQTWIPWLHLPFLLYAYHLDHISWIFFFTWPRSNDFEERIMSLYKIGASQDTKSNYITFEESVGKGPSSETHHWQFGRRRDTWTQVEEAREGRKLGSVLSWQLGNDNVSRRV